MILWYILGYDKEEIPEHLMTLKKYKNIIMKFGRYIPNQKKHFDPVLGVYLASNNQYGEKLWVKTKKSGKSDHIN